MKKTLLLILCLMIAAHCAPAQAKTVKEWLEGYDTGEVWFGEDFHYDITDEAACWELLQRPITVLDVAEKEPTYPLDAPNGSPVVNQWQGGFINGSQAAVHVLGEDEDGWTLIEGIDYYDRVVHPKLPNCRFCLSFPRKPCLFPKPVSLFLFCK